MRHQAALPGWEQHAHQLRAVIGGFLIGVDRGPILAHGQIEFTLEGKATAGDRFEFSTDNGVKAILGDFQGGIYWGIQKSFPFRMLEFGDPDNAGRDLAGHNELLFRTEIVYAWYVWPEKFSVIEGAAAPKAETAPKAAK